MTEFTIHTEETTPEGIFQTGNEYRYKHINLGMFLRDTYFAKTAAKPGDPFPLFELISTNGERLVNSDVFTGKPVVFIFGSLTCPMTTSSTPDVRQLYDEFGGRIDFIMLQVREAHPGEDTQQPETMEEKLQHAQALKSLYGIQWTVAVDNIDGELHRALDPKPNAVFLAGSDGTILFRSLWAGDDDAIRQALVAVASGRPLKRKQSAAFIGPVIHALSTEDETMQRGGPQASRELWRVGFPVALGGRVATFFTPLASKQRGIAAVLTLAFTIMVAIGFLGAGFFA